MKPTRRNAEASLILLAILVLTAATARADGVMAPLYIEHGNAAGPMLESPRQEAALITDGNKVRVVLRTHVRTDSREVAWLVPVPARPVDVQPGDPNLLPLLDAITAPKFYEVQRSSQWLKCGCGAGAQGNVVRDSTVTVHESGVAGIFAYTTLSAGKTDDLVDWLKNNRFAVPEGIGHAARPYVDEGWHWLAMKLRPQATDDPNLVPHPISYRYESNRLVYPLIISQPSAAKENEILLYVLASSRYAAANWPNVTVDPDRVKLMPKGAETTNYVSLFRQACGRKRSTAGPLQYGDPKPALVTEYADTIWRESILQADYGRMMGTKIPPAKPLGKSTAVTELSRIGDPIHLTRLRTIITPEQMSRDVVLVPVTGWEPVYGGFEVGKAEARRQHVAAVGRAGLLVFLLTLGTVIRRRKYLRIAGVAMIALACIALAMT